MMNWKVLGNKCLWPSSGIIEARILSEKIKLSPYQAVEAYRIVRC
jgi:hypothetical protein